MGIKSGIFVKRCLWVDLCRGAATSSIIDRKWQSIMGLRRTENFISIIVRAEKHDSVFLRD